MPLTLKDFAYLPDLYGQLDRLAAMILPEPWRFAAPEKERFNQSTHILERHLYLTFEEQMRRREYATDDMSILSNVIDIAFDSVLMVTTTK